MFPCPGLAHDYGLSAISNPGIVRCWQLIPVWQIRGYDTILDQRLEGILSTYSEEDRIKYDPECVYSFYINALTGELIPI